MSEDVDALIARLAAEGELDGDGGFTLDPQVALAKLREHQLRDPSRFVLSWVRAAVMRGATRIAIRVDADDVILEFDGEPYAAAELGDLWSMAARQRDSLKVASCHELALGINGAFAWEARQVSVSSGAARVEFDRSFAMTRATLDSPVERTVVHAKRPLGFDLIRRRLLDARGALPEELHLARACADASVAIELEGRRLDVDSLGALPSWIRVAIADDEGRRGALVLREGEVSRLRVVKAGVEVTQIDLPYPEGCVEAVIDDPLLPLDLSQDKPVEGERWAHLLTRVERARWQAWFELAARDRWAGPLDDGPREQGLRRALLQAPDLRWAELPGADELAARVTVERAVRDRLGGLRTLGPLTPLLRGGPSERVGPVTLAELIAAVRRDGFVHVSAEDQPELPCVPELPTVRIDPGHQLPDWQRSLDEPEGLASYWAATGHLRPPDAGEQLLDQLMSSVGGLAQELARSSFGELASLFESAPPPRTRRDDPRAGELSELFRLLDPGARERVDLDGPQTLPERLDGARLSVRMRGKAGERGLLGLPADELGPSSGARLRVLSRGRELATIEVPLPLGPFFGVIELPHAGALVWGDTGFAIARLVEAAALELAHAQLEAWIAGAFAERERARVRAWLLALERGDWPEFAVALRRWQASLRPDHPLRVAR